MNIYRFIKPFSPLDITTYPFSKEQRYEFKVAADWGTPALGRSWLRMHPEGFRPAYPKRQVNNLYLDTADLNSFQDNRWGVGERTKLRIRWYGQLQNEMITQPVLELKIKRGLLGDKLRYNMVANLNLKQPYWEILKTVRQTIPHDWQVRMQAANQPIIINRYWREYYSSQDGAIRATLDYDVHSFNQRLSQFPNLERKMAHNDVLLIEVKAMPQHRHRLQQVMGFFPVQRTRNSKYVNGVLEGPF